MKLDELKVADLINELPDETLRGVWNEYVWKVLNDEVDDNTRRIEEMDYLSDHFSNMDAFDILSVVINPFDTDAPYFYVDEHQRVRSVRAARECLSSDDLRALINWVCEHPADVEYIDLADLMKDYYRAEAFYTGGGIWLSAKYISEDEYAVIDSEDPLCLNIYSDSEEDRNIDDSEFPCYDLQRSVSIEDMSADDLMIWKELASELHKKAY